MQIVKAMLKQTRTTKLLALAAVLLLAVVVLPKFDHVGTSAATGDIHVLTCDAEGNIPLTAVKYFIGAEVKVSVNGGTASVYNGTNCNLPVSLASYEMYDNNLSTQKLFDATAVVNVGSGQSRVLNVSVPACMAQVDLYYGEPLQTLDNANSGSYKTLAWTFVGNSGSGLGDASGNFCGGTPNVDIEKYGDASVERGQSLTYTLRARNFGNVTATGVVVRDEFPSFLEYTISSGASCNLTSSNKLSCDVGSLAAGQSKDVVVTFNVLNTAPCGSFTNKAFVSAAGQQEKMAQAYTNVNCPTPELVCSPGFQAAELDQLVHFTATGGTGTYAWTAASGQPITGSGSSFATRYNSVGNKAVTVTSGGKTATCNVKIENNSFCELQITKTANKSTAKVGDEVTYTLTYKNIGTANCTGGGVKVADILDSHLEFVRETHSSNVTAGYGSLPAYQSSSRTAYWNADTLTPGETGTSSFVAKVVNVPECSEVVIPNRGAITSVEYNNFQTWVYSNTVNVKASRDCAPPTLVCSPASQSVMINENANFTATGGTGSYAWTATGGSPATGSGASFQSKYSTAGSKTVTVTSGTQSKTCGVTVTDYPELVCSPATRTVKINENASLTATGGNGTYAWTATGGSPATGSTANFVTKYGTAGSKNVVVTSAGQTKTCKVVVEDYPELVCSPASQAVKLGQTASFVATGGNGTYAWTAPNGNPVSGSSNAFSTSYSTPGSKTVTVTSGSKQASCGVTIEDYPELVCSPASQAVKLGQTASFVATGGNGTYAWTANTGSPSTGTNITFSTSYNTIGSKVVTVTSGSKTATCNVSITEEPQNLVCSPANQTVDVDQVASFVATGGNGTYAWTANTGSPSTGSGASFSTKYNTPGSRTVTVTSGSKSANCNVQVRDIELTCSPNIQYTKQNQEVSIVATGGNGSFSWYAPGANTGTTTGNTARVSYSTSGTKQVTVTSAGRSDTCQVVVENEVGQLNITKQVRNVTQNGSFQDSISGVRSGDVLEYQIVIRNNGNSSVSGVQLNDLLSQSGYLNSLRDINSTMLFTGQLPNQISFNYALAAGQQIVVKYVYTAAQNVGNNVQVCNTATTWATNVNQISDTACARGEGGQPNLVLSKKAFNDTKGVDATTQPASREDYITYTLTVRNTGTTTAAAFVITDDLSGVLPLADMTDLGGGSLSGNTISFPGIDIPAGGSVSKTFKVRVKYHLSNNISYQMLNTYGNTVTIVINPPVVHQPPKTGGSKDIVLGLGFASILTAGFALQRKKKLLGSF